MVLPHRECGSAAVAAPIPAYRWACFEGLKVYSTRRPRDKVATLASEHDSAVELRQLLLDQGDELAHAVAVEDQPCAGCLEQLGQRSRRPERKRLAILADRLSSVPHAVAPDLKGAELGDPVFDVVERAAEKVRLLIPEGDSLSVEAIPVHGSTLKSPAQLEPLPIARNSVAAISVQVDPVLKRID